jgi:hypothetical protein
VDVSLRARLIEEINAFNVETTGIRDSRELLAVETDGDGELLGGVSGWSWGTPSCSCARDSS